MRAFLLVVTLAAACGNRSAPVRLFLDQRECWPYGLGHVYAGAPVEWNLSWICNKYDEGYSETDASLCDRSIVDIQAHCDGVPCGQTVVDRRGETDKNHGARRVRVIPQAPGDIHIEYVVTHSTGTRESSHFTCAIEPPAELTLACTVRDKATGGFVPCPSSIVAGTELHLDAHLGVPPDRGALNLEVRTEGSNGLDVPNCVNPLRDERGVTRSCTWIARPGRHTLRAVDGNLVAEMPLEVTSPPDAATP